MELTLRRTMNRLAVLALVAGAAHLVTGCLSPTLPTPPPSKPDTIGFPDDAGRVRLQGTVPAQPAVVFAINERTGLVYGESTTDGAYDFFMIAAPGDLASLWYESIGEQSDPVPFLIPDRPEGPDAGSDAR